MEKKHLSGYDCAKRKIAKLELEKAALEHANATLVQQLNDARDKWSDANAQKLSFEVDYMKEHELRLRAENDLARGIAKSDQFAENTVKANEFIGERYVWLYEHAPFWLKWWFKHTFKGATK